MRAAWITLLLVGCGEPKLVIKPLPPLAEPQARTQAEEIVAPDLGLEVGERWIWDVQVKGFSIGRVELRVGEEEIESHFRTGGLASAIKNIGHDLVTVIDRASSRPHMSTERVDDGGKVRQYTTQFAGTTAHSFHTALGAIRAWAKPGTTNTFLDVVHADQVFRLELDAPRVQQERTRITGRVIGPDVELGLTIWLSPARTPTRIEIRDGDDRVTAQLISN
jgi:hypothetical protein